MAGRNSNLPDRGSSAGAIRKRPGALVWLLLGSCIVALLIPAFSLAQSGRRKGTKKPQTSSPGPIAEPTRPSPTPSQRQTVKEENGDPDSSDVVRVSSNLVPIAASVIDSRGYAITSLQLDDFELRVDGQLRPITEVARSESPVRLVMLFDNSGSLDFAREFEKHAAMRFFRKVMRPADQAAVYSIGTENYLAQPLTSDIHLLEQTIAGFARPEGSTSLLDGMIAAAAYLRPYHVRNVLVIVSDGIDNTSRADFDTTMQRVLADDCQIYIVQTGLYEGANVRPLAAERRMEQFASQTGGAVYIPKSVAELDKAFEQIASDLAQQYVLSFYPGGEHNDGRFHAIELRVKVRKDVRVRARKGYYSPKQSSIAAGG